MSEDRPPLFGDRTDELRKLVVTELLATHRRHVEAQKASGQSGQIVYGAIWHALPANVVHAITGRWPNTASLRLPHAGYSLPIIGDTLLVPWRPPLGGDPNNTPFVTSPSRAAMFHRIPESEPTLFDIEPDPTSVPVEIDPDLLRDIQAASGQYERVAVVAMESDPTRVWRITWGEVVANADGTLRFLDPVVIYTDDEFADTPPAPPLTKPTTAVRDDDSFNTGVPPKPIIRKRETGTDDR
ncbi:hypothetical protein ACFVJS_00990 [Nocardioides sp. NPDC057772]|uniref:hypothetical protein n=1 Tax=Nocardioides sp. NPDC057772 TaxID=3346245 RepID=UPI003671746C